MERKDLEPYVGYRDFLLLPFLAFLLPHLYDNSVASVVNTKDRDRDSKLGFNSSQTLRNNSNTIAKLLDVNDYTPLEIPYQNSVHSLSKEKKQTNNTAVTHAMRKLPVEKLCELAPNEYKLCWLKKLNLVKSIKDEIKKVVAGGVAAQEGLNGSNGSKQKLSSTFVTQNLQLCFQNWLEENGYKEEIERLGAGLAEVS